MNASLTLQYAIIAVAVLVSAWVVMKKQFPGSTRKLRVAMALRLLRESRPAWQRRIGRWLVPPGMHAAGKLVGKKECGGGCNGCG